jgi:hypothetical protein
MLVADLRAESWWLRSWRARHLPSYRNWCIALKSNILPLIPRL